MSDKLIEQIKRAREMSEWRWQPSIVPTLERRILADAEVIKAHEDWLQHEKELCEASGDRAGTIAYSRALAAFRKAQEERE
jgi:hypothetical protein